MKALKPSLAKLAVFLALALLFIRSLGIVTTENDLTPTMPLLPGLVWRLWLPFNVCFEALGSRAPAPVITAFAWVFCPCYFYAIACMLVEWSAWIRRRLQSRPR